MTMNIGNIVDDHMNNPRYAAPEELVSPVVLLVGNIPHADSDFPEIDLVRAEIDSLAKMYEFVKFPSVTNLSRLNSFRNRSILLCGSEYFVKSQYTILKSAGYDAYISREGTLVI
ncbi:MAG: hypothetical protein QT09_C0012G0003 [archaeon GW2011_AR18]|nr:MAG: hypothetical protein QT09_C0012G0003 [archaeon GW2011_AR18]